MQAARGASLSPGDDHGATTRTYVRLFAVVTLVSFVLDQVTKVVAVEKLQGRESIEIIPGVPYPVYRIVIIAVGLLVAGGLYLFIGNTRIGMLVRAGSTHRDMVRALGVDNRLLYTFVFGLGALLAGLAGLMAGPLLAVQVGMGEQILILTFVVVVIGGVGSTLQLHVQDNSIVRVTSPQDHDVTSGHQCIKGRFGWQFLQNR